MSPPPPPDTSTGSEPVGSSLTPVAPQVGAGDDQVPAALFLLCVQSTTLNRALHTSEQLFMTRVEAERYVEPTSIGP